MDPMPGHPSAGAARRWLDVGRSTASDSRQAGATAAGRALTGPDAKLLLVFCSTAHELHPLLEAVNEASGGVPLIGCSTAGEIATAGPGDSGVVVLALGGPGFGATTSVAKGVSTRLREAGAEVARAVGEVPGQPHSVLLMLTDGLAGNQQEIIRGADGVLGASVPIVGGCAGDDLRMQETSQLHGSEVLQDAVVVAALTSEAPIGIGVRHGWRPVGEPLVVTGSGDRRVDRLDDRPALDVYLERLDAPKAAWSEPVAFSRFALTHPLGLNRRGTEEQVRFVADADFERRSLACIAEVPQGGLAWFMEGDEGSVLQATDAACLDALAPLGDGRPLGLVAFDCIARRGVLGDRGIGPEVERVAVHADGAPVAGFYTYGEIARTRGFAGFHNQTLVVLAVG
jgi:hypothetical protein